MVGTDAQGSPWAQDPQKGAGREDMSEEAQTQQSKGHFYGLNCVPQKSLAEALSPSVSGDGDGL